MRLLRMACLTGVILTLGLSFAHVLEVPGKLQFDGPQWLTVQQHLYVGFGTVGAAIEVLAIVLAWVLTLRPRKAPGRRLALGSNPGERGTDRVVSRGSADEHTPERLDRRDLAGRMDSGEEPLGGRPCRASGAVFRSVPAVGEGPHLQPDRAELGGARRHRPLGLALHPAAGCLAISTY